MTATLTEGSNLAGVVETTLGATTPPTTGWFNLEPNSYGDVGAKYKNLARSPISKNRQMLRPILTDLTSGVPYETDVTKDVIDFFAEGMMMAAQKHSGGTGASLHFPSAITATGFTVAANGNVADGTLFFVRNTTTAANAGLKKAAGTSTGTEIKCPGLTAEAVPVSPSAPCMLDIVGFQFAAGDLQLDVDGNLTATVKDLTTLGWTVGQWLYLPSQAEATAEGDVLYAFSNILNTGYAKIKSIAAGKVVLERRSWVVQAASSETTTTVRVYTSRFCRNVALDHADYVARSYAFELTYSDLEAGADTYEYMLGNLVDEFTINLPLTNKATAQVGLVGTKSLPLTTSRDTGPSVAKNPSCQLAVGTSTDLPRMSIAAVDESGITTDFTSLKVTFKNNVSPENQLGAMGAVYMPIGKFELMLEAEVIMTSKKVVEAVRLNQACRFDIVLRNDDFACLIDVPSVTVNDAGKKFEANKLVKVTSKLSGWMDPTYGCTAGLTTFGYLPPRA